MGAELNAGTGKETTSVYARVIDEHLADAFDVMADMVFRRAARHRVRAGVILEEIAMYEDDPQEKVFDMLGEAVFGDDPLGRAIIGRAEVISDTPTDAIARFHHSRYRPDNVVIAASGAVDHDALVALARERTGAAADVSVRGGRPTAADAADAARRPVPPVRAQGHRAVPRVPRGPGALAPRRPPVRVAGAGHDLRRHLVLAAVPGGPRAPRARLCRVLVHQRLPRHRPGRALRRHAGRQPGRRAVGGRDRAESLARGAGTTAELSRAKENLKGRVVLALESTGARMNRLGSEILAGAPLMAIDEVVSSIDGVTLADLAALTEELWAPERLSAAGIGPDEQRFDEALATIAPQPARTR